MDKMSKKEIPASDENVQSDEDAVVDKKAAPEEVIAETTPESTTKVDAPDDTAPDDTASEKSSEETKPEAGSDEPAAEAATDADEAVSGEEGAADATGANGDDGEEKPRSRTRARRSRSRRKPRNGEKSGEKSGARTGAKSGERGAGKSGSRGRKRSGDDDGASGEDAGRNDGPKDKLRATALWGLHKERRAKMVAFAGYEMPVQYKRGIMTEHRQTRDRAGLFDVSHMGQAFLTLEGEGGHDDIAALMEELVPGDIRSLKPGGVRYTLLLNEEGGIIDDLMVTRPEGDAGDGMLFLVVNAGCKEKDFAHITAKLDGRAKLTIAGDRALIALQGPRASKVLSRYASFVAEMPFMTAKACRIEGVECIVSRCGYTGEDGFEISLPNEHAEGFARKLLTQRDVALVGLGARDSLRLESGFCLYGHDLDEETTPVEANLVWTIAKRRKLDRDFPAAEKIMEQIENGTARRRVGIKPEGKAPARDGTNIVDSEGNVIGKVTSGGFGPTVRGPIAMGYVETAKSDEGTEVGLMVRGQSRPARIVPLPFIPPKQYRPGQEVPEPAEDPAEEPAEDVVGEDEAPAEEPVADETLVEEASDEAIAPEEVATEDGPEEPGDASDEEAEQEPEQDEDKEEDGDERP